MDPELRQSMEEIQEGYHSAQWQVLVRSLAQAILQLDQEAEKNKKGLGELIDDRYLKQLGLRADLERLTRQMARVLEALPLAATQPSSPDTTPTANIPNGESTSSATFCLVRGATVGQRETMATVTFPALSSLREAGDQLRAWLADPSIHLALIPWESRLPFGPTSSTPEAVQDGRVAGGQEAGEGIDLVNVAYELGRQQGVDVGRRQMRSEQGSVDGNHESLSAADKGPGDAPDWTPLSLANTEQERGNG